MTRGERQQEGEEATHGGVGRAPPSSLGARRLVRDLEELAEARSPGVRCEHRVLDVAPKELHVQAKRRERRQER